MSADTADKLQSASRRRQACWASYLQDHRALAASSACSAASIILRRRCLIETELAANEAAEAVPDLVVPGDWCSLAVRGVRVDVVPGPVADQLAASLSEFSNDSLRFTRLNLDLPSLHWRGCGGRLRVSHELVRIPDVRFEFLEGLALAHHAGNLLQAADVPASVLPVLKRVRHGLIMAPSGGEAKTPRRSAEQGVELRSAHR